MPIDSRTRKILDPVRPNELRGAFRAIHNGLQRSNSLKPFQWLVGKLVLAIDGTGAFSSTRVSCKHCYVKKPKRTQKPDENPEFNQQMLDAVIVHPEHSTVLPLVYEPITRTEASDNNNASVATNVAFVLFAATALAIPPSYAGIVETILHCPTRTSLHSNANCLCRASGVDRVAGMGRFSVDLTEGQDRQLTALY